MSNPIAKMQQKEHALAGQIEALAEQLSNVGTGHGPIPEALERLQRAKEEALARIATAQAQAFRMVEDVLAALGEGAEQIQEGLHVNAAFSQPVEPAPPCRVEGIAGADLARMIGEEDRILQAGAAIVLAALEAPQTPAPAEGPQSAQEAPESHDDEDAGKEVGKVLEPITQPLAPVEAPKPGRPRKCKRCGGKPRGVRHPEGGWVTCPVCEGRLVT